MATICAAAVNDPREARRVKALVRRATDAAMGDRKVIGYETDTVFADGEVRCLARTDDDLWHPLTVRILL
jgi:hypothetical protein